MLVPCFGNVKVPCKCLGAIEGQMYDGSLPRGLLRYQNCLFWRGKKWSDLIYCLEILLPDHGLCSTCVQHRGTRGGRRGHRMPRNWSLIVDTGKRARGS